jgi:osmotically-inducible protein OsmY
MMKKIILLTILAAHSLLLSGCLAVIQGASTISSVVTTINDRRTAGEILDDKTIMLQLLTWTDDTDKLDNTHLNFMVYDRVVLVVGEAPNADIRDYVVQQIKLQDAKIEQVINEITLEATTDMLSRAKDSAITLQIETAFLHKQEVFHPTLIRVMSENQTVYLMGAVTEREANKAVKIASQAKWVKRVVKFFHYLKARPAAEIERGRLRDLEEKQEIDAKN